VEAKDFIPVRALVRGQQVEGIVLGWRGDRVYLRWRSDLGQTTGPVPATDVKRIQGAVAPPGNAAPGLAERTATCEFVALARTSH
jgi:hypothetical protein